MHEFQIPIRQKEEWPAALVELSAHLDLTCQKPGIIGMGVFVDIPHPDSGSYVNVEKPFFVVQTDASSLEILDLHDEKGRALLANCDFSDKLLLTMTDHSFRALLDHQLDHLFWADNEDDTTDETALADKIDTLVITDGRAVVAWSAEIDLNLLLACHAASFEADEDEDEEEFEPIDDFVCVLAPRAETSHELINLISIMEGPVRVINELALSNDDEFKFVFDPDQL